jgi:hypothetical protein
MDVIFVNKLSYFLSHMSMWSLDIWSMTEKWTWQKVSSAKHIGIPETFPLATKYMCFTPHCQQLLHKSPNRSAKLQ